MSVFFPQFLTTTFFAEPGMLQNILNRLLFIVIAVDLFALGLLLVFIWNFRVTVKRRISERRFATKMLTSVQKSETTEQVARLTGVSAQEVIDYCTERHIELPETRISRLADAQRQKDEESQRIMEEEAAWRAEQERLSEARLREKEVELKKRKERLRKFGIS
jgi:hypothetical protein